MFAPQQGKPDKLTERKPLRPVGRTLLRAVLAASAMGPFAAGFGMRGAWAQVPQGVPAASPVTSGQNPSAGVKPSSVPQAATAPQVTPQNGTGAQNPSPAPEPIMPPLSANLAQYAGKMVVAIRYEGVDFDKSDKLTQELTQKAGEPFDPEKVRQTTRRLFATGRYRNIGVRVEEEQAGVDLIFSGIPRFYVGRVQIDGVQNGRLTSLLEYGSELNPGVKYTNADAAAGNDKLKLVLAQNGYYEPVIAVKTDRDDAGQQTNVTYTVAVGPQARVGSITLQGKDPGISVQQFRKTGKLKAKTKVTREITSTALDDLRKYFQKKDRLEATVTLRNTTYDPVTDLLNYTFAVEEGPVVKVQVDGAKFSKSRLHLLVPVYQEGTIDIDLLNEGTYNMKDFLQQQGFFDAAVKVSVQDPGSAAQTVLFQVEKGAKHKVTSVEIQGNKYFSTELLKESLKVQKADNYERSGRYSQELVKADEKNLEAIYRANGFNQANVTDTVSDVDKLAPGQGKKSKYAEIRVTYKIVEGPQAKFGRVTLNGIDQDKIAAIQNLLQASPGQPYSLLTLSGDRDAILSYYLSNGYDQARVEVSQTAQGADKSTTDIGYNVTPGQQVFIGKVLESGIHRTRPAVVNQQLRVHAGDPLDQSALLETQRNLYNLALFNEVNAAVQNPDGDAELKNVLVQVQEAKRWDVTYGAGFEVQTGLPACTYCTQQGTTAAQEGRAGISPRVSLDVTRINFRGKDNSLTLHTQYGLLEKVATLSFQNPHLYGSQRFALQVSGGYSNVQDITTFASSKLEGDLKVTEKATRKDTFIYDFEYRRVAVQEDSLAISASLIPQLSEPVRVGGPGITWFHDTRTPTPLDAQKGSYTSVQDFYASSKFGSQTDFNRTDVSNSTYYVFGKKKYVFARDTRVGFIATFGVNPNIGLSACTTVPAMGGLPAQNLLETNATCNPVPLPERLYAGGATSHRGFGINDAGPRDLQTGYPVGGSGVIVNSFELRLPPPVLPIVGDSVSFVIFHDMGNVFQHVGDMFPSIAHYHQPNQQTCQVVTGVSIGTCDFNYFSHALGLGARYKTPVGPIRLDLSYNLNPPSYPVITEQTSPGVYVSGIQPYVGTAGHFNFFFSIGQSF